MEALKIIESYVEELNSKNIVICSYELLNDPSVIVECIDMMYQEQYPEFEVVEIVGSITGTTENYVGS